MSGFKDMIAADLKNVFLKDSEFAEKRTVVYDGQEYQDVPIVLSQVKEKDRNQHVNDHAQGLYRVTAIFHCAADDLDGNVPEKGGKFKIKDGTFYAEYYVAASSCEMGMIRLELEALDE